MRSQTSAFSFEVSAKEASNQNDFEFGPMLGFAPIPHADQGERRKTGGSFQRSGFIIFPTAAFLYTGLLPLFFPLANRVSFRWRVVPTTLTLNTA